MQVLQRYMFGLMKVANLVYSDTPKPGAEEVKTKPGNVFKSSSNVTLKF